MEHPVPTAHEEPPARIGSRAARRHSIGTAVDGRYAGEDLVVLVHDLSLTGCRVELRAATLSPGDWLHLSLPLGVEIAGQVTWAKGRVAGCQFGEPLGEDTICAIAEECRRADEAAREGGVHPASR